VSYRVVFTILVLLLVTQIADASTVLSFQKWKGHRIQEAKSLHLQISSDLDKIDKADATKRELEEARLSQAKLNIDIARELTAADYFVLYLTKAFSGNRRAMMKAIRGMKPADIADILSAYEESLKKRHNPEGLDSVSYLLPGPRRTIWSASSKESSKDIGKAADLK